MTKTEYRKAFEKAFKTKNKKQKPFTKKQISFIRKAFMIEGVQEKFNDWFETNFVFCEETHSFVHKCFDAFKECENYKEAQYEAFKQLDIMRLEFLYKTYELIIKLTLDKGIITFYITPLERLKKEAKKIEKEKGRKK